MTLSFKKLWFDIVNEELFVDDILKFKPQFQDYAGKIITGMVKPDDPEVEAFLKICLDVYTYSAEGEVLITDSEYDQCMRVYRTIGKHENIIFADEIGRSHWQFVEHKVPGVVGTIDKVYNYQDFKKYLGKFYNVKYFIIAPKYDGVSCDVEVEDGVIISGTTRYNGFIGQDISRLIKNAHNAQTFIDPNHRTGHYKCELVVSTADYNELTTIRKYANRRSATAGIINTPKNINLAKFITIIPLAFYSPVTKEYEYLAPGQKRIDYYSPADLFEEVELMLEDIRQFDFPFRVDGVVIHPSRDTLGYPNEADLMDICIAYKVNRAEGKTHIRYGYMSVGRLGKGVPCLKVAPVEVNETIVEDASLGSYDKFLSMDLREGEEVIVFSAGDVIPQIKLPQLRMNVENRDILKIPKVCPYCQTKMTRFNTEYYCKNQQCPRIITGRIANFLDKMGLMGFSDRSIEDIYYGLGVQSIPEFMDLTVEDLLPLEGWSKISATNLVTGLQELMKKPVSVSQFFGSMGIDKISEKKCRKIFEYVTVDELMGGKPLKRILYELQCADGIGPKTAETFIDFVIDNDQMIEELLKRFTLERNIKYLGNLVFTGFRPPKEIRDRIYDMGLEISESVGGETLAVIASSLDKESTKSKAAYRKGIPIYHASELNQVLDDLQIKIDQL